MEVVFGVSVCARPAKWMEEEQVEGEGEREKEKPKVEK